MITSKDNVVYLANWIRKSPDKLRDSWESVIKGNEVTKERLAKERARSNVSIITKLKSHTKSST